MPKPSSSSRAGFPPQDSTIDKAHGRIEHRRITTASVDPETLGLAGAAQIFRIDCTVQDVRKGQILRTTESVHFGFTSLYSDEAPPGLLLDRSRDYWGIENGQHHRRDVAQNEDKCGVRLTRLAQNISVLRSLDIFLFERRRTCRGAAQTLPRFHARNHRNPTWAIARLTKPQALDSA